MADIKEIVNAALHTRGMTQAEAAEKMGWTAQKFGQKLLNKSMKAEEFFTLMDILGMEVQIKDKETNKELKKPRKGHGPRLIGMSDGVTYDTEYSDALSSNFYKDGVNEYDEDHSAIEIYKDEDGRYFAAEYYNDGKRKNRIRSLPKDMANAFIESFGTEIERKIED